jgi:signal transduction histidine kinase
MQTSNGKGSIKNSSMAVAQSTQKAQIRFSTQIIKRLGEELNPSIEQSILELVKNSYDADAKECVVELDNITDKGGAIKINDDGDGMNSTEIIDGWLVLGESSKSIKKRTRLGRIPAGSKGLGRLAALRMGTVTKLESISLNDPGFKYGLEIDWRKFDEAKLVDDVFLTVTKTKATNSTNGTAITIKDLKQKIGLREVKKIARGLILLADPFDDDPSSFKPILKSEEFKEIEKLVSRRYFDDAEYHLVAKVNGRGFGEASVLDYRGNVLFTADHQTLSEKRKGKKYECPVASFDLWAFILSATSFSTRSTSLGEIQDWLAEFGGVHLYENGLRVNPYGNPGNDWLEMNLARTRNPEERPSTNNSIGVVRIKDSQGLLSQKTDRSGFIENDVFHEIKNFCQDALEWMAKRRMEIAERKRRAERERSSNEADETKEQVVKAINMVSPAKRTELQKAFNKYDKARQDEVKSLRTEVQLYRTLSTAGITAATFSHESRGNPIKVISVSIKTIDRRLKEYLNKKYDELFLKPVKSILRSVNSLAVLGSATLKLLEHEKRRVVKVDIHEVIENVVEIFKPFLDGRDITINIDLAKGSPFLRASEAAIESIITNLLNNSITALENSSRDRIIIIKTTVQEKTLLISVSDNGPGIEGISIRDIWLPGQTTNPNGTGLGLTIVRDATYDLSGRVRAIAHGELDGAEIIIELPIIGI